MDQFVTGGTAPVPAGVHPLLATKAYKLDKESFKSAKGLMNRLLEIQPANTEEWWPKFEVVTVPNEKGDKEVKLRCTLCDKQLASSSPITDCCQPLWLGRQAWNRRLYAGQAADKANVY